MYQGSRDGVEVERTTPCLSHRVSPLGTINRINTVLCCALLCHPCYSPSLISDPISLILLHSIIVYYYWHRISKPANTILTVLEPTVKNCTKQVLPWGSCTRRRAARKVQLSENLKLLDWVWLIVVYQRWDDFGAESCLVHPQLKTVHILSQV